MSVLLPCPFCGFVPDYTNDDCIYPASSASDCVDGIVVYKVWELNCYEIGGGCGASVYGDNPIDCIKRWNTRIA